MDLQFPISASTFEFPYSRSRNEDRLPQDQSSSMGHGCKSGFGPGRRRGLICCLVFVNANFPLK